MTLELSDDDRCSTWKKPYLKKSTQNDSLLDLASSSSDEFLLLEDHTCHLGIESDNRMAISPSTLLLIHRDVILALTRRSFPSQT
jgi:hypothetical protein